MKRKFTFMICLFMFMISSAIGQSCEQKFIDELQKEYATLVPYYVKGIKNAKMKYPLDIPDKWHEIEIPDELIVNQNTFFILYVYSPIDSTKTGESLWCYLDPLLINNLGGYFAYVLIGDSIYGVRESGGWGRGLFKRIWYDLYQANDSADRRLVHAMRTYQPNVVFHVEDATIKDKYVYFLKNNKLQIFNIETECFEEIHPDHPYVQRSLNFYQYFQRLKPVSPDLTVDRQFLRSHANF